ncbi:MAG: hypothetical protein WD825_14635 [Gemmatimonadaceae bacterium]
MQYTIRNIPAFLDRVLRRRARERDASLNEIALEALARGMGLSDERVRHRNLSDLAGSWAEDPEFDDAIREQDTVDERLWP